MSRWLGVDFGSKYVGVAVGDEAIAMPLKVLDARPDEKLLSSLKKLAASEDVAGFVVGLPVNMDGSEGPRAQASRAFVRNMERLTPLPFAFWDERLSTVAAERALIEMDVSRGKRAARIDSAAACHILQGVLDRLHQLGGRAPSPAGGGSASR